MRSKLSFMLFFRSMLNLSGLNGKAPTGYKLSSQGFRSTSGDPVSVLLGSNYPLQYPTPSSTYLTPTTPYLHPTSGIYTTRTTVLDSSNVRGCKSPDMLSSKPLTPPVTPVATQVAAVTSNSGTRSPVKGRTPTRYSPEAAHSTCSSRYSHVVRGSSHVVRGSSDARLCQMKRGMETRGSFTIADLLAPDTKRRKVEDCEGRPTLQLQVSPKPHEDKKPDVTSLIGAGTVQMEKGHTETSRNIEYLKSFLLAHRVNGLQN